MAALLTSVKDRKDEKPKYIHVARKMQIPVLIPDVNSSDRDFTPVEDSVRFGLSAVRHVGEGVVEKIIEARERKGAFQSFQDFCRKVDYICLNRKTIESLIKAGAFESVGHSRKGLLESFETISAEVVNQRKQEEAGQFSLFGGGGGDEAQVHETPIGMEEHPKRLLLAEEKEVLGMYVSDHPLLGIEGLLQRITDAPISALADRSPGEVLRIGGIVSSMRKRVSKKGDIVLLLDVEDLSGASVETIVFANLQQQLNGELDTDEPLLIKGRVDRDARDDTVKLVALDIKKANLGEDKPLEIEVAGSACTEEFVHSLKSILANHPGSTQVLVHLRSGERTFVMRIDSKYCVDTRNGLYAELKAELGANALISA
jgi:DNA polymerase-3 subunit alpha